MEIFKDVVGYEKMYQVSNNGNVKSLPKLRRKSCKILKAQRLKTGYLSVDLGDGKNIKRFLIHRLVAEAFIKNIENKEQVNHKNGIKSDNRVENLEWNTRSENQKHSIQVGLRTAKGEKNSQAKLIKQDVLYIRKSKEKGSVLAKKFNISRSTICDIKNGRSWKHV